jgi:hypothetical protein
MARTVEHAQSFADPVRSGTFSPSATSGTFSPSATEVEITLRIGGTAPTWSPSAHLELMDGHDISRSMLSSRCPAWTAPLPNSRRQRPHCQHRARPPPRHRFPHPARWRAATTARRAPPDVSRRVPRRRRKSCQRDIGPRRPGQALVRPGRLPVPASHPTLTQSDGTDDLLDGSDSCFAPPAAVAAQRVGQRFSRSCVALRRLSSAAWMAMWNRWS